MMASDSESTSQVAPEPRSDETRQRILHSAAEVFADKGYARATTRALAAAAGVNEVTLFRHFGNKQNLFAAVIEQFGGPAVTAALETQLTGVYAQDLLSMGRHLMQVLLERKVTLRLMLCEATHFPEVQALMAQNPRRIRQMLAKYLQQQIEQGQVRDLQPEAMAQAFAGMFFSYAIGQGILGDSVEPELSTEELVAQFVDIFVQGTIKRD